MWLFLINPLKLCSYGSWSLQGYVCKSSCCQCHIYIYSCLDIEMFKTLSVHFIDWWLCRSHSATQPLCQSGWCSHSATLPEWLEQPVSHSATLPEWPTQPLSHSAGEAGGAATQTLSHSAGVAGGAATQPLSYSARVARSHSATQPLCQSGWSSHSATQSLCQSGWSSHSATQSLCQSGWSSHSATQSGWVAEWLRQPLCQSGWCENFRHCAFNLYIYIHTHTYVYIYICIDRYRYRGNNNGLSFQFCQTSIHWYFVEAWKKSTSTGSMHAMNIHCFQSFGRLVWSPQPIFHQIFVAMQDAIHVSNTVSFCPLEWEVTHPQPNSEFPTSVIFW